MRAPVALHPHKYLVDSVFTLASLVGISNMGYLVGIFNMHLLIINGVQNLFMYLLTICISSVKCLLESFAHFYIR